MARIQIKNLEFQSKNGDIYGFEAVSKSDLDAFDPKAHEARVNTFIDKAKKEVVTLGQLDEFDTNAYKDEVNAFINEAKKDVLTVDKFDAFDTNAYKKELQTIADGVTNKMSIFNELTKIDIDELKAQIKAGILAELRGAGA